MLIGAITREDAFMGYEHRASKRVERSTRNTNQTDGEFRGDLANGFDDGWDVIRNDNGTRNGGWAEGDGLLAYLAFHGKEAFDAYTGAFRFEPHTVRVRGVDYRIPQHGVLTYFTFQGRDTLRQVSQADGPWRGYHSENRDFDSERKRIGRMLSGIEPLHPGWLEMLGYGLGLSVSARRKLWQLFGSAKVVAGMPGKKTKIADYIEEHVYRSLSKENFQVRRAASELDDLWRETIERRITHPVGYPAALGIPVLAQMLTVANLEEGWEKEYEAVERLYSGMNKAGSAPALEAVFDGRRTMVLGDPGHGKSTLLAGAALRASEQGFPVIFARLEDLGAASVASRNKPEWGLPSDREMRWASEMLLEAAMESGLPSLSKRQRDLAVGQIITDQDLLVVLDGWDEVSTEEHRSGVEDVLKVLAASGGHEGAGGVKGRIILASRVTGYRRPVSGLHEVLVTLLDSGRVLRFFQTWFGNAEGEEALSRVRNSLDNPKIAELARIPVLAGFIAVVAEQESPRPSKQGLYEQYLDRFLARGWKDGRFTLRSYSKIQERLRVGASVAWRMATWPSSDPCRIDQWEDHLSVKELGKRPSSEHSDTSSQWYEKVENLAVKDGLLVPHGRLMDSFDGQQRYRWLHRTIHEHLVGRHLVELLHADLDSGLTSIRQVILRPSWEEALEHAAGFLAQEGFADVVIEDLWAHRSVRDIGGWFTRRMVQIAADSAAQRHRTELLEELFLVGEYMLAGVLDPAATVTEIGNRLTGPVSANDAEQMALMLSRVPGPEALELCRRIYDTAEFYSRTVEQVLEEKLLEHEPKKAQRLAIEAYAGERPHSISEWTFPGATKDIADLLIQRIQQSSSPVEWVQYMGALAARGYTKGSGGRSEDIDRESRKLLEGALGGGLDREFLLSFYDRRISSPEWYRDWDWIPLDLRYRLATQENVSPLFAFLAGGYVHQDVPADWMLSPWARVGSAAGAISPDRAPDIPGQWTQKRAASAIAAALASPLETEPALIEEFHWAVNWALINENVETLSAALEVLYRNYDHHPKHTWCWDSNTQYFARVATLPWLVKWNLWKSEVSRFPQRIPNLSLSDWISKLSAEERLEKLHDVTRWFVEESPEDFNWFPISYQDLSQNIKDVGLPLLAQELMALAKRCRTEEQAMTLLEVSASWHQAADTLEHFWPAIISTQNWIRSNEGLKSNRILKN